MARAERPLRRVSAVRAVAVLASLLGIDAPAVEAQDLVGYGARNAAPQRALETSAARRPTADRARAHSRALSARSHIAGTPAQAITRDYVLDRMREWGLETETREYQVWLPHSTEARVWRVAPDTLELVLAEGSIPGDSVTMESGQIVMANGYSGAGDVSGEVVYVNYGLIEDYTRLDSLGISVRGKVAIARYGRSFRGIKAREAERNGATALLLYSDPADDGYVQGDPYPDGPMRPATGVQRGSVMNGVGDPTTPGWASVRGARRLPPDSARVPRIPVIPLSWSNAAELLRDIRGASIPQEWQGGLPFRYHVGPGPVRARVLVRLDTATSALKSIWNTFGTIKGTTYPDQLVILGAHRDSWGPGAVDDVSGTVSILEAARAVAEEARAGRRPKRTIVFATWDAEEWGLIGSTEYVEEDAARLTSGAVAYLNQDVAAQGADFGAGGSPSLRGILRDIVKGIEDPSGRGTIYSLWRTRSASSLADTAQPAMGDPGGGSDFAGFYNHPRDSTPRLGLRRPGRCVPLSVRYIRVDLAIRRSWIQSPYSRGAHRHYVGASPGERRRPALRLCRIRAHDQAAAAGGRARRHATRLATVARHARARHRRNGAGGNRFRWCARCDARPLLGAAACDGARERRIAPGRTGAYPTGRTADASVVSRAHLCSG